jgi:hypothetical protein
MKVLLFKKTTDNDLFKGLKVAYNKAGEYQAGVITAITEQDGKKLYNVAGALYLADELKLIEQPEINDFEELKQAVIKEGLFVPVTERLYYYALEVLPPIWLKNNTFQMGECVIDDMFYTFGERSGKYYGCLCNKNFSIHNF